MKFLLFVALLSLTLLQIRCYQPISEENADSIRQEFQSFEYLNDFVGKTPNAVGLWQTEPLHSQLSKLVGDSLLPATLKELRTAKALKRDHVLYTIAPHSNSVTQGYIVALFDTIKPGIAIIYIQQDTTVEIQQQGARFYWPDEVRNLMFNYQGWQVYEGVLPCHDCDGIKTTLALDSAKGTWQFFLQQAYLPSLEEPIASDTARQYWGNCEIVSNEDTILHITSDAMPQAINLRKRNNLELELLNEDLQEIDTDQNLLLTKIN